MDLNIVFGQEFETLMKEERQINDSISAISLKIKELNAANSANSREYELQYSAMNEYILLLSNVYLKISTYYRHIDKINNFILEQIE